MSDKRAELIAATRDVIDSLTSQAFMFTALDISNEVKRHVTGVRHRDISPVVRELFDDGAMGDDYTRATIDVVAGNKKVKALLYYEKSDDPEDYDGSLRQQRAVSPTRGSSGSAAAPAAAASASASAAPAPPPSQEMNLRFDRGGRAIVPKAFLYQAGITEDTVYLDSADVGSGLVLKEPTPGVDPLLELEYEGDAVHIPQRYLAAFDTNAPLVARIGAGSVIDIEGRIR